MGLALCAALLRPETRCAPRPGWCCRSWRCSALMLMSAQLNAVDRPRAAGCCTSGSTSALALAAAQGRFHTRSMAKGLAVGLLVSAAAYYAGYGTGYAGRLAGLMADPNAAGYMLTTLGCLALAGLAGQPAGGSPSACSCSSCVVLTYSRTSLLAVGLIVVWVLIGRRLAASLGSLLLAGMIWIVTNMPGEPADARPVQRPQSAATHSACASPSWRSSRSRTPPGTATAPAPARSRSRAQLFFFHNSYLAIQNEGGGSARCCSSLAGAFTLFALLRLRPELTQPLVRGGDHRRVRVRGEPRRGAPGAARGAGARDGRRLRPDASAGPRRTRSLGRRRRPWRSLESVQAAMTRIYVAANRGDIGGGEVMLLRLAAALAELGYDVTAVVPSTPSNLAVRGTGRRTAPSRWCPATTGRRTRGPCAAGTAAARACCGATDSSPRSPPPDAHAGSSTCTRCRSG